MNESDSNQITVKQVFIAIWQYLIRQYHQWQERRAYDDSDPLHLPRVLRYRLRSVLKWGYLVLAIGCVPLAITFTIRNPFEETIFYGQQLRHSGGSPVICGVLVCIAVFLFSHYRYLAKQEQPDDEF